MNQYKMVIAVLITAAMFFLSAVSAWAEPDGAGAALTSAQEIAPADAIDTTEVAEATGLDIVMDGSSLEAFEKSMERVKETGSEGEYRSLKGALDYLLIYDLGARGNREKLATRLDGKTGHDIVARIQWGKKR